MVASVAAPPGRALESIVEDGSNLGQRLGQRLDETGPETACWSAQFKQSLPNGRRMRRARSFPRAQGTSRVATQTLEMTQASGAVAQIHSFW